MPPLADYSGRWKMLHYYALKFFSPVLVSPFLDGSYLNVFVVIDEIPTKEVRDPATRQLRMEPMTHFRDILDSSVEREDVLGRTAKVRREINGVLNVEMYAWNSFVPLHKWTVPYKVYKTFLLLLFFFFFEGNP